MPLPLVRLEEIQKHENIFAAQPPLQKSTFCRGHDLQGLFVPKKLEVKSEQSHVEMIKWQGNLHIIVSSRMTQKDVWKRVEDDPPAQVFSERTGCRSREPARGQKAAGENYSNQTWKMTALRELWPQALQDTSCRCLNAS